MNDEFIQKMARYVAFLSREKDIWANAAERQDMADIFATKLETVLDICAMFDCKDSVLEQAVEFYLPRGDEW